MRKSDNLEDRRGMGGKQLAVGGGVGGIIIAVLFLLLGGNPDEVMQTLQPTGLDSRAGTSQPLSEKDKQMGDFVSVILAQTEEVWRTIFEQDAFTHGTSAQRVRWFTKGYQTGDINQGDTFKAKEL